MDSSSALPTKSSNTNIPAVPVAPVVKSERPTYQRCQLDLDEMSRLLSHEYITNAGKIQALKEFRGCDEYFKVFALMRKGVIEEVERSLPWYRPFPTEEEAKAVMVREKKMLIEEISAYRHQ